MLTVNSTIRFPTLNALKAQAQQARFINFEHAEDARGRYFTAVELHPSVAKIVAKQDARAREAAAKRVATGGEPAAPKAPKAKAEGVPVTKQIRDWVHANPAATKAEAQAHFSHLNPGTVGVQFGAAKRGVV